MLTNLQILILNARIWWIQWRRNEARTELLSMRAQNIRSERVQIVAEQIDLYDEAAITLMHRVLTLEVAKWRRAH